MSKGTRDIYWLSSQASILLENKIEILRRFQIEVQLIDDFNSLARAFTQKRLGTIIISDSFKDAKWRDHLQTLTIHPEYAGVRFLLSLSSYDRELCDLAASLGFRDIIPIDLKPEEWLKRYFFSASGQAQNLAEPAPLLSARHIAGVHVPARISWMTEHEFWLETRLVPPVGTTLHLAGGPAAFLGLKKLSFKVLEHHQTHLHFRYSDALLCRWDLPIEDSHKKAVLIDFLRQQKQTDPYRIYSIIRSKEFRKDILMQLDPTRFQLSIALNKTNMIHEPRYIGPDAIIIEDKMCLGPHYDNFVQMLQLLHRDIPIFIIGPQAEESNLRDLPRAKSIERMASLPKNLAAYLIEKIGSPQLVREGVSFIPKYHRLSYARILLPARIIQLHPEATRIALPFALGRYSLCSLEAPFLQSTVGRQVKLKVIQGERLQKPTVKAFPFECDALLADLLGEERQRLAKDLVQYYQDRLEESGYPIADSKPVETLDGPPAFVPPTPPPPAVSESKAAPAMLDIPIDTTPHEQVITRIESTPPKKLPRIGGILPAELRILILTLLAFGALYLLIIKFRSNPTEENSPFIKSIRLFKESSQPPSSEGQPADPELRNLPE